MTFRLRRDFRYVHEPLVSDDAAFSLLGNQSYVEQLVDRIRHSRGGAFLVTGFRGAGKSTIVLRAAEALKAALTVNRGNRVAIQYVPVYLSVARPMSTAQLLFAVIRRCYEELADMGMLARVPRDVRTALEQSYHRTVFRTKTSAKSSSTLGLGIKVLSSDFSTGGSRERAIESQFLDYSDADAEHDFMRIVGKIVRPIRRSWLNRVLKGAWRAFKLELHPVIILDELDKLTATEAGQNALEALLSETKNLLTMTNMHFVFVGGPDLYDRHRADTSRGNSLYESVFSWAVYLPCLWGVAEALLKDISESSRWAPTPSLPGPPPGLTTYDTLGNLINVLGQFLNYRSRGIPRRLFRELNALVRWEADSAHLDYPALSNRRMQFFSRLEGVMSSWSYGGDATVLEEPIDRDRKRLGAYSICEWVIGSLGRTFIPDELLDPKCASIDPLLALSPDRVTAVLEHLKNHGIIEKLDEAKNDARIVLDPNAPPPPPVYRLEAQLMSDIQELLKERASVTLAGAKVPALEEAKNCVPRVLKGRYEIGSLLGQGGMSSVYQGVDRSLRRPVAIKIIERWMARDPAMKQRFRREANVGMSIEHPHLVKVFDFCEEDEILALVMELVVGESLAARVSRGPLAAGEAVAIAVKVLLAVRAIAEKGLCRLDLKPSNIILRLPTDPVLLDLGIVKHAAEERRSVDTYSTAEGAFIGTPRYMSPEQARGVGDIDIRSDLYGLGLVLYEMLAGHSPFGDDSQSVQEIIAKVLTEAIGVSALPVSGELQALLARLLERDRDRRFQTPDDLLTALLGVAEAAGLEGAALKAGGSTITMTRMGLGSTTVVWGRQRSHPVGEVPD